MFMSHEQNEGWNHNIRTAKKLPQYVQTSGTWE
jgi:hypothetical protein